MIDRVRWSAAPVTAPALGKHGGTAPLVRVVVAALAWRSANSVTLALPGLAVYLAARGWIVDQDAAGEAGLLHVRAQGGGRLSRTVSGVSTQTPPAHTPMTVTAGSPARNRGRTSRRLVKGSG